MTPSLEWLPTKAKEATSPHEARLAPLDTNQVFQCLGVEVSQTQYFTVCQSKQTLWDQGWKKEFVQADLFVQKAGNKIAIDITLVLGIFRNSFKVPLKSVDNMCVCYQAILHPTFKWSQSTSQIA